MNSSPARNVHKLNVTIITSILKWATPHSSYPLGRPMMNRLKYKNKILGLEYLAKNSSTGYHFQCGHIIRHVIAVYADGGNGNDCHLLVAQCVRRLRRHFTLSEPAKFNFYIDVPSFSLTRRKILRNDEPAKILLLITLTIHLWTKAPPCTPVHGCPCRIADYWQMRTPCFQIRLKNIVFFELDVSSK